MIGEQICIINHFPVYPPRRGGQLRVYCIAKHLAEYFDVKILTLSHLLAQFRKEVIFNRLVIENVSEPLLTPSAFMSRVLKLPLSESVLPFSSNLALKFKRILARNIVSSEIVIAESPYVFPLIASCADEKILVYDAHNVEFFLKSGIFARYQVIKKLVLPRIKEVERFACTTSRVILATCKDDKRALASLYSIPFEKIRVVPNGVDCSEIVPCSEDEKTNAKKNIGLEGKRVVSFMGSEHPPNIEAAEYIISNIAPKLSKCEFLILGSVTRRIKRAGCKNVRLMGFVDEEMKKTILKATDIAINPMSYGSGTNLKMLEYLAAGLPIVSTPVGARGIELENYKNAIISRRGDFVEMIEELLSDSKLCKNLGENGRKLVEERYDWKIIVKKIAEVYKQWMEGGV